MTGAARPGAPSDGPPSLPADWASEDRELATQIALDHDERTPSTSAPPCACGGAWRYVLRDTDARRLWRCLHCGALRSERRR